MKINVFKATILILIISATGLSQFGKNKVQYDSYQWSYLRSDNLDIYFYTGGEALAEFAAPVGEQAIKDICKVLNWKMRKRVTLVIYNSHSDFQQTNVTLSYLYEGIGGFTELFKNRAVVPYDGSYYDFWHVVRHELVHVVINDMIYGGNVQSIISGRVRLSIPGWMNEGLAEYISYGWTAQTDLIMRDIALNSDIPSIEQMDYYLAYQGGNSVYRFIAEKYGIEKIGQIWAQMKSRGNADKGLKMAIGLDMKELTDKWQRWMRTEYWPDIADRDEIQEVAVKITDHKKLKNYFNTGPAISPLGDKIALMSDRKGYADIFLVSATDGKVIKRLVSGQRTPDLEELKWLNPRLSWSPDGKKIVIAVKSGARDALIIVDIATKKRQRLVFDDLEEIFTAAWSPDGKSIAFVGLKDEKSDLYLYDLNQAKLSQITNDEYPDFEPAWSPDSRKIIYTSQRTTNPDSVLQKLQTNEAENFQTDLFYIDLQTREITRLTDTPWNENYPVWAHTRDAIIYTSDFHGISNLFIMDLNTHEYGAITNVLTGIFQPSLTKDDQRLVFAGYADMGWDIYSISNPLDMLQNRKEIKPTVYANNLMDSWKYPEKHERFKFPNPKELKPTSTHRVQDNANYTNYVFAPNYTPDLPEEPEPSITDSSEAASDTSRQTTRDGKYPVTPYKTKFTLDMVESQAGYSTFWGLQGTTIFAFSDILGNHQLTFGTEMYIDLENSDYYLSYMYLAKRINYAFTGFHSANFWSYSYFYMWRLRNYGFDISVSRPASRYTRLDVGATSYNVEQNLINIITSETEYSYTISTILPRASLVFDNSLWGYLYPIDGWRTRLDFIASPKYRENSMSFYTIQADIRRYFKVNMDYSFGLRLTTGLSNGANAQRFFIGGEDNWINQKWRYDIFNESNSSLLEDIYFSDFITPLRGARYYERYGTRYFLANLEFRYPFIKYLALGWPLPLTLGGIQGVTFLDFGSAWNGYDLHPFQNDPVNGFGMDDLVAGYGVGSRIYMYYFVLKIDVAWRFDWYRTYKPAWYFSFGLDF